MTVALKKNICSTLAATAMAFALGGVASAMSDPFETAALAPPDATLFVHVDRAAEIRRELVDRPIAVWIQSMLTDGKVAGAWSQLAKRAGSKPGPLFDHCLGASFTVIGRRATNVEGTPTLQWALITQMPNDDAEQLLHELKARVREPRRGMALSEVPEQAVLIARDGQQLIVGPMADSRLFDDVLDRIDNAKLPSLRSDPALKRSADLGNGCAAVFLRHAAPLGGWSAAVAELRGEQLTVHHAARFDSAPFMHGVTKLTCDFSPVVSFEKTSLLALMQPMDVAGGPFEAFLTANSGEKLISRSVREDLGDRRLLVFSESSGPPPQRPADVLSSTMVSCLELKNAETAAPLLEKQLAKLADRNTCLGQGALLNQTETAPDKNTSSTEPLASPEWLTGGFPVMSTMKLCWTVADGPNGCWFVIAGDPHNRDRVATVLKGDCGAQPCFVGRFDSCGVGNGVRVSKQLQSWNDQARQLAKPGRAEEFITALSAMSDLAAGVQNCRWQLARPSANEMRLDLQVTLAPPESAHRE